MRPNLFLEPVLVLAVDIVAATGVLSNGSDLLLKPILVLFVNLHVTTGCLSKRSRFFLEEIPASLRSYRSNSGGQGDRLLVAYPLTIFFPAIRVP